MKKPAMPTWKRLLIAWLFVPLHRRLFRLSRGRILGRLENTGALILVTTGRKSGLPRSSPLLYFRFEEHGDIIVIASNYGLDRDPEWCRNLAVDPRVTVEVTGERFAAEARITGGEERVALFEKVITVSPRFALYRDATHRDIPVVALRRV